MSKSIYDEALEIMIDTILPREGGKVNKTKVIKALEQAQKQEKLLEELKVIFNRHSLRLDRMREWFNLQILESKVLDDIEKLIKEIENDKERTK